jgi:16S rRNA (adenine1518-N6/adenine1519-N6)-dimethyltransferase
VAVETDSRLIPVLNRQLGDYRNVEIIHADILETDIQALLGPEDYANYIVVANLPYYITSAILRHLLEAPRKPRRLVLTIQQEVAERLIAKPGDLSLLAISVQFYGKAKIVTRLNPATFWPRPEVSSAVVRIDCYEQPLVEVPSEEEFFTVVRAGFSQKRKQIKNAIGAGLDISHIEAMVLLEAAGIDPTRRAETLEIPEWAALTRVISTWASERSGIMADSMHTL